MTIAAHDRSLPVLLITGPDPALLGAVDAVEELWELSSVEKWQELPGVGAMVDFLFRAGRKGKLHTADVSLTASDCQPAQPRAARRSSATGQRLLPRLRAATA